MGKFIFRTSFLSLLACIWQGLTITVDDLSTNNDFSTIITKISQETDTQGRNFLDWDTSVTFYQELVTRYPYLVREFRNIGTTEEGNNIYAMHMSYQYTSEVDSLNIADKTEFLSDVAKPSIIIVGGHYGNSLLSHHYVMTLIGKLIHGFHNGDSKVTNLLKLRHIWIVPYLNIDSYKHIQSYAGNITDVQEILKNRKVLSSWNVEDYGVNLMNNYAYNFGVDNFGSTSTECLSHYRGVDAFSEKESKAFSDFYTNTISPTLVLAIESSGNYVKIPYNYANDDTNTIALSSNFAWFYNTLAEDMSSYDLGIRTGNNLALFSKT